MHNITLFSQSFPNEEEYACLSINLYLIYHKHADIPIKVVNHITPSLEIERKLEISGRHATVFDFGH